MLVPLAILFFILSPGVLLTLPPTSKGFWMSRDTSIWAALFHGIVLAIVYRHIRKLPCMGIFERFQDATAAAAAAQPPPVAIPESLKKSNEEMKAIAERHLKRARDLLAKRTENAYE
jgi:hypothetical protein